MITDSIWHQEPDTTQTNTGRRDGQEQAMGLCTLNTVSNSERAREREGEKEIVHVFACLSLIWIDASLYYVRKIVSSYFSHIIYIKSP